MLNVIRKEAPTDVEMYSDLPGHMVNNTVIFRNRFVGTKGYQKERRSGEVMAKGAFGTAKPGL